MVAEVAPGVGPKARIFISYSRKDMAFADRIEAALKARGFEPLIDRTEIYSCRLKAAVCAARRTQIHRDGHSSQFATSSASAAQTFPLCK
jgi:hypothetical protein